MRTLTTHQTNECNRAITLEAGERNENGATQDYYASWYERVPQGTRHQAVDVPFQHGPIKEVGNNGLTLEVLLAIVIDQLEGHQSGKYACVENLMALDHAREALNCLEDRTKKREERGVEGTHEL